MDKPIKCTCGKLIARVRDGKLYLMCKGCKKEVPIEIDFKPYINQNAEP